MSRLLTGAAGFCRRHRRAVVIGAVVAVLVLGPGAALWLRHTLGEASASMATERTSLGREQRGLASTRAELGAAVSELTSVTSQRHAAEAVLARIQGSLQAVQAELAATTATIGLQGPHVVLLGRCLDGVTVALNQAAVVDVGSAASLAAVATTCEQARSAITGAPLQ